jgi:hypothetical protein
MTESLKRMDDLLNALVDDRELIRKNAPNFFSFKLLGCKENDLSRCIKDLLNPKGTHGQDSLFLEEFIKKIKEENSNNSDWIDAKSLVSIKTEEQTSERRRIDIFLEFQDGIIGIENKPWIESHDLNKQISSYIKELEQRKAKDGEDANLLNYRLIYLSPSKPSKKSISDEALITHGKKANYQHLNFESLAEWLRACTKKEIPFRVSFFIKEMIRYIELRIHKRKEESHVHLRKYLENQTVDPKRDTKLKELFSLASTIKSFQDECLENFIKELTSLAEKNEFQIILGNLHKEDRKNRKSWKSRDLKIKHTYFSLKDKKSPSLNVNLTFEFMSDNLKNLQWGLRKDQKNLIKDLNNFKKIFAIYPGNLYQGDFVFDENSMWWPSGSRKIEKLLGFKCSIDSDWEKSHEPWLKMLEGNQLAKRIVDEAIKVRGLFEGHPDLLELKSITPATAQPR